MPGDHCPVRASQRGESCHCTASQQPATPATTQPLRQVPLPGRNPTLHTPTNSPHSSNISSLAKSGGRPVFTAAYQRRDARLREPFVRSDVLCLPTKDYETNPQKPRASSLTRPGEGRAPLCRQHSLIASAEAERRQQLDFLLLIPWESGGESAESKTSAAGLVLQAWVWPARQGGRRLTLCAPSCAPWPGLSKGDSSRSELTESASVTSLTSAAELVPGREADLPNNQNWKIRTGLIAQRGRGVHQLLSSPVCCCPSGNFAPASRNLFWWF